MLAGVLFDACACRQSPPPPAGSASATAGGPAPALALFRDVTSTSGVSFTYRNGQDADHYAILESLGGGVALLDYDGDGRLDLFLTGGGCFDGPRKQQIQGHPCGLFRNLGGWKFRDATAAAGLGRLAGGRPWFYTHGAAVADYDNDGWPDLLVTGWGRLALFHNEPDGQGGRRFVDVTQRAGLTDALWSTSAAWGDLDGDGYADLYVCHYVDWSFQNNPECEGYTPSVPRDVCPPKQFEALPHLLCRNNGDGTFTDVSKEAGLRGPRAPADYERLKFLGDEARAALRRADRERDFGKGLGVVVVDVDGDGRTDVYVANDTTDKLLYVNRSTRGKIQLEELGQSLGVAMDDRGLANGSMGVDAADYDHSGRPSLLVTNFENEQHALYQNVMVNGRQTFRYATAASGLGRIGRQYVGFGTGFLDVDGDGWEDIFITNGHVIRHPTRSPVRQRPVLLRNQGPRDGKGRVEFVPWTAEGGGYFQADHQGRGVAVGDLDNDGRPDLIVSHVNDPVTLLRNEAGQGHHWLGVQLVGPGNRDVVGAKLTLEVGGQTLTRFAKGGTSYLASGDRRHLFGLGAAQAVGRLTVAWPWGQTQTWDNLGVDRYWQLVAGQTDARAMIGAAGPGK